MVIETYIAESVLLRVEKLVTLKNGNKDGAQVDIMNVYLYDAADKINKFGKDAINSFVEGDELMMMQKGLKRFTKQASFNVKEARRRIADQLIAENKYCF